MTAIPVVAPTAGPLTRMPVAVAILVTLKPLGNSTAIQPSVSVAPALIYEEGSLIKRSLRDVYSKDIDEVVVEGARQLLLAMGGGAAKGGHFHSDGTFHAEED